MPDEVPVNMCVGLLFVFIPHATACFFDNVGHHRLYPFDPNDDTGPRVALRHFRRGCTPAFRIPGCRCSAHNLPANARICGPLSVLLVIPLLNIFYIFLTFFPFPFNFPCMLSTFRVCSQVDPFGASMAFAALSAMMGFNGKGADWPSGLVGCRRHLCTNRKMHFNYFLYLFRCYTLSLFCFIFCYVLFFFLFYFISFHFVLFCFLFCFALFRFVFCFVLFRFVLFCFVLFCFVLFLLSVCFCLFV